MPTRQLDDDLISSIKIRASEQGVNIAGTTYAGVVTINGINVEAWRIAALAAMCKHRVQPPPPPPPTRRL